MTSSKFIFGSILTITPSSSLCNNAQSNKGTAQYSQLSLSNASRKKNNTKGADKLVAGGGC